MTVVIGTDEAGYGPNLGPLVVAASVWEVDGATADVDDTLAAALATAAAAAGGSARLWADSKQVYKSGAARGGQGLAALEQGALTAIAMATRCVPEGWHALAESLGIEPDAGGVPEWPLLASTPLPRAIDAAACRATADRVRDALATAGAALRGVACRVIQPRRFNALLAAGLNKSDILSQTTLALAAETLASARGGRTGEPAVVWCDRHGGRKAYAPLVARHFDCPLVQPLAETASHSAYDVPAAACRVEFSVGGERRGPVALASMTAKYVRELAMHAFNEWWGGRSPGLAATAGYPVDAARWRRDAAAAIRAAAIAEDDLWRRA